MKAAVFHGPHQDLTIEEVDLAPPLEHEVVVKTAASGVCHSDLHFVDGLYPLQAPAVLGHEAAGVVEEVGALVTYVSPGDRVILCSSAFCGQCRECLTGHPYMCSSRPDRSPSDPPRLSQNGRPVAQFAWASTYAERMLVHETSVVKIDDSIPLDRAALVGCGVITGVGAVLNTAKVEPGSTVAVFGAGGVGLSIIQGAYIAGARMIVAVDVNEFKLATARSLGATHAVDASSEDPVQAVLRLTDGGADYSFEAIGKKETAEQAFHAVRPRGTATIVGMVPMGENLEIPGNMLLTERKLIGSLMGSNRFRVDMPRLLDLFRQGRLKLDEMITRRGRLADVNEAFRAMKAGEVARTVLLFD